MLRKQLFGLITALLVAMIFIRLPSSAIAGGGPVVTATWFANANLDAQVSSPNSAIATFSIQIIPGQYKNSGVCKIELDENRDGTPEKDVTGVFTANAAPGGVAWGRISCEQGLTAGTIRLITGTNQHDYPLAGQSYRAQLSSSNTVDRTKIYLPLIGYQAAPPMVHLGPSDLQVQGGQEFKVTVSLNRPLGPSDQSVTLWITWTGNDGGGAEALSSTELTFSPGTSNSQEVRFKATSPGQVIVKFDQLRAGNASLSADTVTVTIPAPNLPAVNVHMGPAAVTISKGQEFDIQVSLDRQLVAGEKPVTFWITWSANDGGGISNITSSEVTFLPGQPSTQNVHFRADSRGHVQIRFDQLRQGNASLAADKVAVTVTKQSPKLPGKVYTKPGSFFSNDLEASFLKCINIVY